MKDQKKKVFLVLVAALFYSSIIFAKKVDNPFEGQGTIYEEIFNELNGVYDQVGKLEAQKIIDKNMTLSGGLNSIGLSIQKPFLNFYVSLDRNLAPDLFSDTRYVVTDTMTITIDAARILNKLSSDSTIDLNQKNLALYAGLVFSRKFTWIHLANSYEDGLMNHFEKLFFPFKGIGIDSVKSMGTNEIITREDSVAFNAGGFVSAPIYQTNLMNANIMAGILSKLQKISKLEITRKEGIAGAGDDYLIAFEKEELNKEMASIAVTINFLKILQFNLFSSDFSYEKSQSNKTYTLINAREFSELKKENPIYDEYQNILKGQAINPVIMIPYVISEEKKLTETLSHRYNFLLMGGSKKAQTQQITLASKGVVKNYFKHYYEKIKFTENALSKFFASLIYALTHTDVRANTDSSDTKTATLEYKSEENLIESEGDLLLDTSKKEESLSLAFDGVYLTKKTTGPGTGPYRDRAIFLLQKYSVVDPKIYSMIDTNTLVAPFTVSGHYQVTEAGILNFNHIGVQTSFDLFDGLCDDRPRNSWLNFRNLFDGCRLNLQNDYMDYLKDVSHEQVSEEDVWACQDKGWKYIFWPSKRRAIIRNCLEELTMRNADQWNTVPMHTLKNIVSDFAEFIDNRAYFYALFGNKNVFFHGTFEARTPTGSPFITYFHEGDFKGLGIVDDYMRKQNLRSPASIVVP